MSFSVGKALTQNYARYYADDPALHEWRRLGAIDKAANIRRLCSQFEHDEILEIGCGDGAILERLSLSNFGCRFAGVEISSSAVRCLQSKSIPNVEIRLFDGYELAFAPKRFDLAVLGHVLEHVEYPRKLIDEAAKAAQNVFVEVPLEDNSWLTKDFVFDRVGHINFYNVKTIRRLVQSCRMKILNEHLSHSSIQGYIYRKGRLRGILTYLVKEVALKLSPRFAPNFFTYHYSLVYAQNLSDAAEGNTSENAVLR